MGRIRQGYKRELQRHLPFTVLKLLQCHICLGVYCKLQRHLPFTVLKLGIQPEFFQPYKKVATALTVYGIETRRFRSGGA